MSKRLFAIRGIGLALAAVLFSLVVQGITMKPLLNWLQISGADGGAAEPVPATSIFPAPV